MNPSRRRLGAFALAAGLVTPGVHAARADDAPAARAHVETSFTFTIPKPMARVAPLFGADGERAWGGEHWSPVFVHPVPARDVAGEVFQIRHGGTNATWVNTALDLVHGHVQYVYIIPDAQAVLIDIRLVSAPGPRTTVRVVYQRTSLGAGYDEHVRELARHDAEAGTEWAAAIDEHLAKAATH